MPSFYKILFGLSPQLKLPQGFVEKYGEILPRKAELRIGGGATWDVRVEKLEEDDDDNGYFFTKGWTKFSQDMGLQILQLLVFSYAGDSTFDVSVYAISALEKVPADSGAVENPKFHVLFKDHNQYRCHIPGHFKRACLMGKKEVTLEYRGGRSQQVGLNWSKGRVAFGKGWLEFWKGNRLTVNETYSLEFVPVKNVIRVRPHHQ